MTILLGVLIFGLLIFVHELGHFLVARAFRMKVHAFSVGMGPAIWKKTKGDVEYSVRLLPIGGYVKLEGEDADSEDPDAFCKKKPYQRLLVLLAGGVMNIIAGFLIFLILFSSVSAVRVPVVDSVVQNTPAAASGIMPGDKIIKINKNPIHIQNDVSLAMMKNGAKPLTITVLRNGEKITKHLTPMLDEVSGGYIIGFYSEMQKMTPFLTLKTAYYNTVFSGKVVYYSVGPMISGGVKLRDMSGPVGIVDEMKNVAKSEMPVLNMLNFMGMIAVNLGIMNLLPIPALDGGRIFFILVEMIRRKPIKPEHEGLVHFIGLALLLLLMVVITFSDITKLFA